MVYKSSVSSLGKKALDTEMKKALREIETKGLMSNSGQSFTGRIIPVALAYVTHGPNILGAKHHMHSIFNTLIVANNRGEYLSVLDTLAEDFDRCLPKTWLKLPASIPLYPSKKFRRADELRDMLAQTKMTILDIVGHGHLTIPKRKHDPQN